MSEIGHARGGSWETFKSHDNSVVNRRASLNSPTALRVFYAPAESIASPIPGNGLLEPPVLPDSILAGAAARASAAAHNGNKNSINTNNNSALPPPPSSSFDTARDSESGIGIDLREHSSDMVEQSSSILVRCDPLASLPAEIVAHMLSYLDPVSLMNCELVSHTWHEQACSPHVWWRVFYRAYGQRIGSGAASSSGPVTGKRASAGMGKMNEVNQNWKKMFLVRCALQKRWKEGKAAAIYLQGHKDSVYCVQFDE